MVLDAEITPDDFRPGEAGKRPLVMAQDAVKRYIGVYEAWMKQTRMHPRTKGPLAQWRFV